MNWNLIVHWLTSMHVLSIGDERREGSVYAYLEWCPRHGGVGLQWGLDNVFGHREIVLHLVVMSLTVGRRTAADDERLAAVWNGLAVIDDE